MRILMMSLDRHILDPASPAAKRMIAYGAQDELFILVIGAEEKRMDLSETVHVRATGGAKKWIQWRRLHSIGQEICRTIHIDMITAQDPFFIGLAGYWLKKQFGVPLEIQLHGDYFGSRAYSSIRRRVARYVIRRADRVRAVGERVKRRLLSLGIPEERIVVRPIQIPREAIAGYQPKQNLHKLFPEFEKIFLAIGRLDPIKNIPWLVDVFAGVSALHPAWGLVIVGDGEDDAEVLRRARERGIAASVRRLPWTNDPWSFLKTADCVVFSSISEGYGLIPMEAHAAGVPVVMTDVGVANYELKPGSTVTIVPVGDREAFLRAMLASDGGSCASGQG